LNLFRPGQGFNVVIELQLMDLKYTGGLFAIVILVRCIDSSARSGDEVKISPWFKTDLLLMSSGAALVKEGTLI
jgi:hypothetical protein